MFNAPVVSKCNREPYIKRTNKKNFLGKKSTFSDVVKYDSMFDINKFAKNVDWFPKSLDGVRQECILQNHLRYLISSIA